MPKLKLTKRAVEAAKPLTKDLILWDTELKGFGCKVTPNGRKVYFLYYRTASGQQRRPTIGVHGAIEADKARALARQWLADVAQGKDPSAERKASREAETVEELAQRYLAEYAAHYKKGASAEKDRANLENHILPLLGRKKVQDVTRADIERAKHGIRIGQTARTRKARPRGRSIIRGGPVVANRCVALLSKMFERAEAWGIRQDNPARRIGKYKEEPRRRFLNAKEISRLHAALDSAEQNASESRDAIGAIRLLLYTGARKGEIAYLRWREVDFDAKCLRLGDSKTGPGVVPLGSVALAVLSSLPNRGNDQLVIQGAREGTPLALTRPWQRIRAAAQLGDDVKLHSLRHTFASWSVMGGFSLAQTGAVLRHKSAQTTLGYAHHELESQLRTADAVSSAIAAVRDGGAAPIVPMQKDVSS